MPYQLVVLPHPPPYVLQMRLFLVLWLGVPAVSELYAYLTRPQYDRLGQNTWLVVSIGIVECLCIAKFGRSKFNWMPPTDVALCWGAFAALLFVWGIAYFCCGNTRQQTKRRPTDGSPRRASVKGVYCVAYLDLLLCAAVLCLLPLFRRWQWETVRSS